MSTLAFNIRHTNSFRALRLRRVVFVLVDIAFVVVILFACAQARIISSHPLPMIGIGGFLLWIAFVLELFRRSRLKALHTVDDQPENIAELLSYHMVLHLSSKTSFTPQMMLEAATESERGMFVLRFIGISRDDVIAAMLKAPEESLETCLLWCLDSMRELKTKQLDSTATIYAFLTRVSVLTALLEKADLSTEDLRGILKAEVFHFELAEKRHHPLSPDTLVRLLGSIGRSWVIGYNTDLERLTDNLSEHILIHPRSVVIHQDIIKNTINILQSGSGANILLLGHGGTGKRTLVRNITYALRSREIEHSAAFTDVLLLKTSLLLSGSGQSDTALLHALNDAKLGGRFILIIDELTMLLKAADAKLKDILVNILQAKNIRTICIADTAGYHTLIKTDPLLDSLLQKTVVEETDDTETTQVLLESYFHIAHQTHVHVTYKALKSLLSLCRRYIANRAFPGKAVDILNEALLTTKAGGHALVTDEIVRNIISRRTHIDVQTLGSDEKDKLLHLKEKLQSHIIGQEHAIETLVAALKRSKLNVGSGKRPIGTFLFLGTTGLGKTETAKALATEYFGSPESMIRIDLNEYGNEDSVRQLIGGQTGTTFTEGFLTKKVQDTPFSLILLDEIEKAHPKILNLFLQILDEGILISGDGEKTDFRSCIIIATSNAGSRWMAQNTALQEQADREDFRKALLETIIGERTFSPEFINRFDEVILFAPPTPDEVLQLATLMLSEVIQRFWKEKGIRITVEPAILDLLVEKGFSTEYGAREMRRTITRTVEDYLAEYLLTHAVTRGGEIAIRAEDLAK